MNSDENIRKCARIARFFTYLEKHKIYELFFEIITLLIIKQPEDHIFFMKTSLHLAAKQRDTLRIILLSPPDFDKKLLAEYLKEKLKIRCLTQQNIQLFVKNILQNLAKNVKKILTEEKFDKTGWLFIDFPKNKLEAKTLQTVGLLPTHVIEIIWSNKSDYSSVDTLNSSLSNSPFYNQSEQQYYDLNINDLRTIYANKLTRLMTAEQTYEELGNLIIKITKRQRYYVPCIFRVLLIGSRGSGRRSVARYLSQRYGLVHVDFNYLLEQTRKQNSPLGEELRRIEYRGSTLPKSDIRIKVVENKLMSHECIRKGWVLTGYPLTVKDFQLLNSLTTPPNRIIFLNVDQMTCRERLLSRRFNLLTGSEHHLSLNHSQADYFFFKGLDIHSKNFRNQVEQDLKKYEENIEMLLKYAEESVNIIDGAAEKRIVQERVDACLTCAFPNQISKLLEKMKSEQIQYQPVTSKISHSFYKTDSEFSLI